MRKPYNLSDDLDYFSLMWPDENSFARWSRSVVDPDHFYQDLRMDNLLDTLGLDHDDQAAVQAWFLKPCTDT